MTYLDPILNGRRAAVAVKKESLATDELRVRSGRRTDHRDFAAAIRAKKPAVIAEFKRASPSAGAIAPQADAARIAAAYERGGAAAISVLTEPAFFAGSFEDLEAVRAAVAVPVLCKDFVVDEYQLWEAAAAGADAVLLIAAVLDDLQLGLFVQRASLLGLAPVVEVHDEQQAARAIRARASIIGINNRDLQTFRVDRTTAQRVRASVPPSRLTIAESGFVDADEVAASFAAGFDAVLVGEALMRADDPERALLRLRGEAR